MIRSLDTGLIAVGPTLWLCSLNGLELSAKTHLRVEVRYTVPRSHRSIARFFSSASRCLWVSQSRENSLYIYRHPHGTFRLFGRTFLGRVQHYVSARSHVAVKSIQGWHAIGS